MAAGELDGPGFELGGECRAELVGPDVFGMMSAWLHVRPPIGVLGPGGGWLGYCREGDRKLWESLTFSGGFQHFPCGRTLGKSLV